ncbi:hypothetical protein GCM10023080_059700 [Streptomyces pseudoechinosporeus]
MALMAHVSAAERRPQLIKAAIDLMSREGVAAGSTRAIGTVVSEGRQTALAQAQLVDATDRLLAHATSSCMLFPVPPPQG